MDVEIYHGFVEKILKNENDPFHCQSQLQLRLLAWFTLQSPLHIGLFWASMYANYVPWSTKCRI